MPLLLLTFLTGVAYIPGLPSYATAGRWAVVGIGSTFLLCRAGRLKFTTAHWIGVAFLAWCAALFATAFSFWDHLGAFTQLIFLAAAFCVAAEADDLVGAWLGICLAAVVNAVVGAAQFSGYAGVPTIFHYTGLLDTRAAAIEFAVFALIGAVYLRSKIFAIAPVVTIALLGGREWFVAILCAGFAWSLIDLRRRERAAFVAMIAVLIPVAVLLLWISDDPTRWVGSIEDRFSIWRDVGARLTWTGHGLGTLAIAFQTYEFAHNEFLQYAFEAGIGSALLWGVFVYAAVWHSETGIAERAAVAAAASMAFVYFPLHEPSSALVIALCAGHLAGLRGRDRVAELAGRAYRGRSISDAEPVGAGAVCAAGFGGNDIPAGSKPAMGVGELRGPLFHISRSGF